MWLFKWLRSRSDQRSRATARPCGLRIESLEARQLLSVTPLVTSVQLVGPATAVRAVVINFNESMDPASAQNVHGYVVGTQIAQSSNNGFDLGNILGFLAKPKQRAFLNGKVQFSSAVYDDTDHTVTLTPVVPFSARRIFRLVRIWTKGPNVVNDASGNPFDGGTPWEWTWAFRSGKAFHYRDNDGDIVTIRVRGAGAMSGFFRRQNGIDPIFFLAGANAKTVVTASIVKGPNGDGMAKIGELEGFSGVQNNLVANPLFQIESTQG